MERSKTTSQAQNATYHRNHSAINYFNVTTIRKSLQMLLRKIWVCFTKFKVNTATAALYVTDWRSALLTETDNRRVEWRRVDASDLTCNTGDGNQTSRVLSPDSRRNCLLPAMHLISFEMPLPGETVCSLRVSPPLHRSHKEPEQPLPTE